MSRPRADTLLAARQIKIKSSDVLEAGGQWGVEETLPSGFGVTDGTSSGRGDGGEVVQHDLYGDYDDDAGGGSATPPTSKSNNDVGKTAGVRITRQEGFTYTNTNNSEKTVNRWSIENNVALLVLKKELQIDRSAVRERRVAKKLDQTINATPRALAGSMTPRGSTGYFGSTGQVTPRSNSLVAPSQPHSGTSGPMSPRGNGAIFLDFARLGNSVNGLGSDGSPAGDYQLPPPVIVTMPEATILSRPLQSEVEFLLRRCSELVSIAGIQSGEDIVSNSRNLHRRVHLLNERVLEELSNRIDHTSAAIRKRDTSKDILAKEADMTQAQMAEAFALSKVVDSCYEMQAETLAVIKRLHSLRMIHQEVFQRVGALALLRSASQDTDTFIANAPDEIEEMRLGAKEVCGAVNESLEYFRQRLKALK